MRTIQTPVIFVAAEGILLDAAGRQLAALQPLDGGRGAFGVELAELINLGRLPRTDQEVVDQTNDLARICMRHIGTGYEVPEDFKFYDPPRVVLSPSRKHRTGRQSAPIQDPPPEPRAAKAWEFACAVQELLFDTDPNDALANLDLPGPEDPVAEHRAARVQELEEIVDGAYGDNPMVRGLARDELARLRQQEANASSDGWIAWVGGDHPPVNPGWIVEVKLRGLNGLDPALASGLRWRHEGSKSDIIAYRIVEERR